MNKYSELSDFDINLLIGNIWLTDWAVNEPISLSAGSIWVEKSGYHRKPFDPCNSWADGGPIIEENNIDLINEDGLSAACDDMEGYRGNWSTHYAENKNVLRAAMEVFLMMGDAKNDK